MYYIVNGNKGAYLLWFLAIGEVKELKPLLVFSQCKMKLAGQTLFFSNWRLILKIE